MIQKAAKKRLAKPSRDEIARARAYIKSMDWVFSRSMPQWPHWYLVRESGSAREFDFIARLIKKFGYSDKWGNRSNSYLVIEKFKYWVDDDVLKEYRKRGLRYAARRGKRIGPWGRLINNKKKRDRKQ